MHRFAAIPTVLGAALMTAASAQTTIDNMNEGEFAVNGDSAVVSGSTTNIAGGSRYVGTTGTGSTFTRTNGNDFATFSNQSGGNSTLTLDYGDFDGGNGPLNGDFGTGNNYFAFDVPRATGAGQVMLALESGTGVGMTQTQTITGPGTYYFDFNDAGFGDVDLGDVDRATFRLQAANGAEFDIGQIFATPVPAPASALTLLGLAGFASTRRRR